MVVEPGDPGAMAEALLAVLGASSIERGHLGEWLRNRALTLFTAQRMFDDYDDVYRGLFEQVPTPQRRTSASRRHGSTADVSPVSDRAMAHAVS